MKKAKDKRNISNYFFSLLLGGISFFTVYYFLNPGTIISALSGIIGFLTGMVFLFPSDQNITEKSIRHKWSLILQQGNKRLQIIKSLVDEIDDHHSHKQSTQQNVEHPDYSYNKVDFNEVEDELFSSKAKSIYTTGSQLMQTIRENTAIHLNKATIGSNEAAKHFNKTAIGSNEAATLAAADKVVSYYMLTAIKLLERYTELSRVKNNSSEIRALLTRVDSAVEKLLILFKKQFKILLHEKMETVEDALVMLDEELDWED